jgi:hypothetical protein
MSQKKLLTYKGMGSKKGVVEIRLHPDVGGSHGDMLILKGACDLPRNCVRNFLPNRTKRASRS